MTDFTAPLENIVRRQTDKALLVQVTTGRGNVREVWLPKSQVRPQGRVLWVAPWLCDKKCEEEGGLIKINREIALKMAEG